MFQNKKVALIGPAPHILDRVQDFSGYDIVCRVKGMLPIPIEMIKYTGFRCDVWYPANGFLKKNPDLCLLDEVKFIRCSKKSSNDIPIEVKHKWSRLEYNRKELKEILGATPNRGLIAMIDIVKEQPAELYITGFTFYQGDAYYPGYTTIEGNSNMILMKGNAGNHIQEPQINYFREKILPFVKVDWKMKQMFNV